MDQVRTPCAHRGGPEVVESLISGPQGDVTLSICKQCRRFWLERGGWLLSKRETIAILRNWPLEPQPVR